MCVRWALAEAHDLKFRKVVAYSRADTVQYAGFAVGLTQFNHIDLGFVPVKPTSVDTPKQKLRVHMINLASTLSAGILVLFHGGYDRALIKMNI